MIEPRRRYRQGGGEARSTAELWHLVFGDPGVPGDRGALGRIADEVAVLKRLMWGVLITLLATMATLVAELLARK